MLSHPARARSPRCLKDASIAVPIQPARFPKMVLDPIFSEARDTRFPSRMRHSLRPTSEAYVAPEIPGNRVDLQLSWNEDIEIDDHAPVDHSRRAVHSFVTKIPTIPDVSFERCLHTSRVRQAWQNAARGRNENCTAASCSNACSFQSFNPKCGIQSRFCKFLFDEIRIENGHWPNKSSEKLPKTSHRNCSKPRGRSCIAQCKEAPAMPGLPS